MCYMAGANAFFTGERKLTTPTSRWDEDLRIFERWGIRGLGSLQGTKASDEKEAKAISNDKSTVEVRP
ncbi:hypothetical protein DFH28DRAFT_1140591 [Melampsora americana]|nr:hypothetical protein DFH28DRAFT_1140591 [Melampsora americana]